MIGRWLGSRRGREASARDERPTPVELRVHLPLLWPEGPDGPIDDDALRALGRDYARSGRTIDELLADLDILCSVVGIGASSRMIEASSVAWSDTFLDTVAAGARPAAPTHADADADADAVVRRVAAFGSSSWGDLAPDGCVLVIDGAGELEVLAHEVGRVFPDAVVAVQSQHRRLVAAVARSATTDARIETLRARCGELVAADAPRITVLDSPGTDEVSQLLTRPAG